MIVGVVCVSSLLVAAVASWLLFWFAVWMVGLAVNIIIRWWCRVGIWDGNYYSISMLS